MDDLKDKLCYLASPYSYAPGGIDLAYANACRLAAKLSQAGFVVYSPVAESHGIAKHGGINPLDHDFWMRICLAKLMKCDALIIARLDGWQISEGMITEAIAFELARRPIYDLDPATMELTQRIPPRPARDRVETRSEDQIESERASWLAHGKTRSEQSGASM